MAASLWDEFREQSIFFNSRSGVQRRLLTRWINTASTKRLSVAESEKYELLEITVDSGAAESVVPPEMLAQFPTEQTLQSLDGEQCVAANGCIIEHEGERKVSVYTHDWKRKDITYQVTGVNKALASVSKICGKGHRVVFDAGQSFIRTRAQAKFCP